jgi:hypothetical protein
MMVRKELNMFKKLMNREKLLQTYTEWPGKGKQRGNMQGYITGKTHGS